MTTVNLLLNQDIPPIPVDVEDGASLREVLEAALDGMAGSFDADLGEVIEASPHHDLLKSILSDLNRGTKQAKVNGMRLPLGVQNVLRGGETISFASKSVLG